MATLPPSSFAALVNVLYFATSKSYILSMKYPLNFKGRMSKKYKIRKKISGPIPERSSESKSIPTVPPKLQKGTGKDFSLIAFDRRTILFLVVLVATYIITSSLKIHTSSIARWDQVFGIQNNQSVITGTPRPIRVDEWMLNTPALAGQYNAGMPLSSSTMGDGNVPAISSFPIKDFSVLLKPNLWSYFIFDLERAFAFYWNFNIFFFLISTFLLFQLLTKNKFWLSVAGTFFIFLSGGMQWWSYWMGTYMIYLNAALLSLMYLLYAKQNHTILSAAIFFLFGAYGFATLSYPPWQVPLAYLYLAIFAGMILSKKEFKIIKEKWKFRTIVLSLTGLLLIFFFYHYWQLIKDTANLIMNTAYPGKRSTNGGDLVDGKLFSEFFGIYLAENHFPPQWLNICEASSFIMFFPVIFYVLIYNWIKYTKPDILILSISGYIIIILIWIILGFPSILSKVSLLSMSPVYRTLPVLGAANCILLIVFLGSLSPNTKIKFSWIEAIVLTISFFILLRLVTTNINNATNKFFSNETLTVSLLFTVVYLLIRYSYIKYTTPAVAVILLAITVPNFKIHPVTKGLSSILENPVVKSTKEIQAKDPNARWAVFGNQTISNLLKVNGINVFNGVKVVPQLKDMAVLDPSGKNNFIYNRYAHINLFSFVDGKDSVGFKLNENKVVNDNYSIFMDPCSPRLNQLGVKYFIFTYRPQTAELRCMTKITDMGGILIYKRN